jgi:hypothetical protein
MGFSICASLHRRPHGRHATEVLDIFTRTRALPRGHFVASAPACTAGTISSAREGVPEYLPEVERLAELLVSKLKEEPA